MFVIKNKNEKYWNGADWVSLLKHAKNYNMYALAEENANLKLLRKKLTLMGYDCPVTVDLMVDSDTIEVKRD